MSLAGALILVLSAYFLGRALALREGEVLKGLDAVINMLNFVYRRMETEGTPLYLLFEKYKDDYLETLGFLPLLRAHGNLASRFWGEAVGLLPLTADAKNELLHFGETLGTLDLESQLKRINACIGFLRQERETLRISVPLKQKSIKTVAFLFGALTAIVLL